MGSSWGQPVLNLGSTWGQPLVEMGVVRVCLKGVQGVLRGIFEVFREYPICPTAARRLQLYAKAKMWGRELELNAA